MSRASRTAPLLAIAIAIAIAISVACGDESEDAGGTGAEGVDEVGGAVVATIDGVGITASDVRREAELEGVTPRAALDRLIEQELLYAEAERRGLAGDPEVRRVVRRALAQRALEVMVESEVTAVSIEEAAIREAYERAGGRYRAPEKRASRHLLIRVPEGATEAVYEDAMIVARRALAELVRTGAPDRVYQALQSSPLEGGLTVVVEDIPAIDRSAHFEPAYLEALFSGAAPGLVREPVRTRYGVHVVNVTAIVPAVEISLEEVREEIVTALVVERRRARLEALLDELRQATTVEVDEAVAERALAREPPE